MGEPFSLFVNHEYLDDYDYGGVELSCAIAFKFCGVVIMIEKTPINPQTTASQLQD